ncbi:Uncharacterized protein dnm_076210 [Desulfonema magnum]|uniref:Uncharacterized protein n=1 Tax=Desulfonema magnum TaxID=45655 RepID=A0A975BTT6_9BACT|nr:Uncharacterized protein dnm_076210 [Desulfonema magnum]
MLDFNSELVLRDVLNYGIQITNEIIFINLYVCLDKKQNP